MEDDKIISVRLSPKTYEELDFFAMRGKGSKMKMVRVALEAFLETARAEFNLNAINAYINLQISEKEFLEHTQRKTVPKDIAAERKKQLEAIKNGKISLRQKRLSEME